MNELAEIVEVWRAEHAHVPREAALKQLEDTLDAVGLERCEVLQPGLPAGAELRRHLQEISNRRHLLRLHRDLNREREDRQQQRHFVIVSSTRAVASNTRKPRRFYFTT